MVTIRPRKEQAKLNSQDQPNREEFQVTLGLSLTPRGYLVEVVLSWPYQISSIIPMRRDAVFYSLMAMIQQMRFAT